MSGDVLRSLYRESERLSFELDFARMVQNRKMEREIVRRLDEISKWLEDFYNDPMTQYYGI